MKQTFIAAFLAFLTAGAQAQTDWQQRVDTELSVTLDDVNHELRGHVRIAYQNNSPETLEHVWIHLGPTRTGTGRRPWPSSTTATETCSCSTR